MADKDGDKVKKGADDLDLSKNPVIIEMSKTIKGLGMLLTQQGQAQAKTSQSIDKLIESIQAGNLDKRKKEDDNVDPDAINELDNSQLVPLVLSEVGKLLDQKLGNLDKKIDKTDKVLADTAVAEQVKALIGTNPDLFEWGEEIKAISNDNPKLSVKQLYTLAKDSNPTKVAELEIKYKDKSDEKKAKPGLIGLMPTSGVMSADDEKLTKKEAVEQAWEDTLENFPAMAQLGEG